MARVLISMPESFLGKIDEVADLESRSRSELIREALRSYITRSQVRQSGLADKNARILEALLDQAGKIGKGQGMSMSPHAQQVQTRERS